MNYEKFLLNLKDLIAIQKLRQKEIAEASGKTQTAISENLSGNREMSVKVLLGVLSLCRQESVDLDWLLFDKQMSRDNVKIPNRIIVMNMELQEEIIRLNKELRAYKNLMNVKD